MPLCHFDLKHKFKNINNSLGKIYGKILKMQIIVPKMSPNVLRPGNSAPPRSVPILHKTTEVTGRITRFRMVMATLKRSLLTVKMKI